MKRWLMLLIPRNPLEKKIFGGTAVIREGPKGIGREVRLASIQETGIFGLKALPPGYTLQKGAGK